MKRILFFGIFEPGYARTDILTEGFTSLGYEIVVCRVDPHAGFSLRKYATLWRKGYALRHEHFDHVMVLFPGHTVVWLARLLFGNRIIFDAFVSLYDSNVHDRRRYSSYAFRAVKDRFLDWSSCALARVVLVDTRAHEQYFADHIGVPLRKIIVVPVGASYAWFRAGERRFMTAPASTLLVGFHGSYIPLHGIPYIVQAATLLIGEPIRFRIVGSGQEYARVQELVRELGVQSLFEFAPMPPLDELIRRTREIDICLGVFGDTEKAGRVLAIKVWGCAALGKPIITADTPAVREIFSDRENIFLCECASPESLAKSILVLAHDAVLRRRLGASARSLMQERFTPKQTVRTMLSKLPTEGT